MGRRERAQYIDRMPALPRPRHQPSAAGGFWSWLTGLPGAPCRTCGRWQRDVICPDCLHLLAPVPSRCPRCAITLPAAYPAGEPCGLCEDYPPAFDRAVAAIDYVAPWTGLIGRLKFHEEAALAATLGGLLAERVAPTLRRMRPAERPWVLAAPLSDTRLRERGYNQAALLARHVAGTLRLPFLPHALHKTRHTDRLMGLSADERRAAIRGAYAVRADVAPRLAGRHVALVDDVMTTGATLDELTRTLEAAGVRSVSAWVLARTPAPERAPGPTRPAT